jgi:cyclic pyranopterin monophosphate synthase
MGTSRRTGRSVCSTAGIGANAEGDPATRCEWENIVDVILSGNWARRRRTVCAYSDAVAEPQLTHVDAKGAARMVDVSGKDVTIRRAVAAGTVTTTTGVIDLLHRDSLPKGDAIATARLAGIMGAKRTPDLIPLCHPIALHGVSVDITLRDSAVDIEATVKTADRTGVEMEALTAVAAAGLAMIDMIKAVDPAASLDGIRVLRKEGGKTGTWVRP